MLTGMLSISVARSEIECPHEILICLPFTGMLGDDQTRHVLEYCARPEQRLSLKLLQGDVTGRSRRHRAFAARDDGNCLQVPAIPRRVGTKV
jgi:hypothetical protein